MDATRHPAAGGTEAAGRRNQTTPHPPKPETMSETNTNAAPAKAQPSDWRVALAQWAYDQGVGTALLTLLLIGIGYLIQYVGPVILDQIQAGYERLDKRHAETTEQIVKSNAETTATIAKAFEADQERDQARYMELLRQRLGDARTPQHFLDPDRPVVRSAPPTSKPPL